MPSDIFFSVNHSSWNLRSHGSIFLYQPFAHTNSYFHSCVPSSVSLWNQLPENFHHCLSLPSFKFLIDNVVCYNFFWGGVNFALPYAICSCCVYISNKLRLYVTIFVSRFSLSRLGICMQCVYTRSVKLACV